MKSCLLLLALCATLAAQSVSVEGDVIDAVTGAPIDGAYISAFVANGSPLSVRTDASGHFRVEGVPHWMSLRVVRTGYRFTNWSAPRPASPQSSQDVSGVRITLTPEAVIAGKVLDEDGFPVEGAFMEAMSYRLVNGERQLQPRAWAHSNDLGQFRLAGLLAGRYRIRVRPGNLINWDSRYVALFFPGGLQPGDTDPSEVKTGQELSGVELRLTKYEGVSVTGRVVNPDGDPPRGLTLISLSQAGALGSSDSGTQRGGGNFSISHVPPGNYVLRARSAGDPPKPGDLIAQQQVQVGQFDVAGLVPTFHEIQAVDLPGMVVLEGGGKLSAMTIGARSMGHAGATARSDEDGSFVLKGLLPGHYDIQVQPSLKVVNGEVDPAWIGPPGVPVSALLGEKEVLRGGFDLDGRPPGPLRIALGSRHLSFHATGTILDAAGRPLAGASVMLLSSDPPLTQTWAETDSKGTFTVSSSVPGEFRVFVAPDQSQTELLSDLDFIEAHKQDYPPIRLVDRPNPPFTLKAPTKQRAQESPHSSARAFRTEEGFCGESWRLSSPAAGSEAALAARWGLVPGASYRYGPLRGLK